MDSFGNKGKERATDDALFLERLDMLFEQSLADIRAFAERECRTFDEIRKRMAELHSKYLFEPTSVATSTRDRKELTRSVLLSVSRQMECLETLAGLQSFFLVVDPTDQADEGFLGGTLSGREFWRGHRGCGSPGAQMFKAHCVRAAQSRPHSLGSPPMIDPTLLPTPVPPAATGTGTKGSARELKAELYAAMRDALRAASGVRTAEMKWTNHSKLDAYGVRLVGWPDTIPLQNPSTFSVAQNKRLLEMLGAGQIFFERLDGVQTSQSWQDTAVQSPHLDEEAMFEDAIDFSWTGEPGEHDSLHPDDYGNSSLTEHPDVGEPTTPKKRRIGDT
ncbi:hypothetical protein VTO73DRAFT_8362 [Trametes versicolor]